MAEKKKMDFDKREALADLVEEAASEHAGPAGHQRRAQRRRTRIEDKTSNVLLLMLFHGS